MRSTQDVPRLWWLNGKVRPTGYGARKGISGHGPELADALKNQPSSTPPEIADADKAIRDSEAHGAA